MCQQRSREFIDGSQLLTEQIYCQGSQAVAPFTPWLCQAWLCQVLTIEVRSGSSWRETSTIC
ncbi:hypothetical protein QUA27_03680 [Microcoleus sp. Pol14C6]|uniref:hypothetical protein n=1 Tax=unclassified Microcoleus TaxID=2642155 RepID=UPI002FD7881C